MAAEKRFTVERHGWYWTIFDAWRWQYEVVVFAPRGRQDFSRGWVLAEVPTDRTRWMAEQLAKRRGWAPADLMWWAAPGRQRDLREPHLILGEE